MEESWVPRSLMKFIELEDTGAWETLHIPPVRERDREFMTIARIYRCLWESIDRFVNFNESKMRFFID